MSFQKLFENNEKGLTIRDCLDIRELSPLMLNKLIDRIEISSQAVVDRQRQ